MSSNAFELRRRIESLELAIAPPTRATAHQVMPTANQVQWATSKLIDLRAKLAILERADTLPAPPLDHEKHATPLEELPPTAFVP